MNINLQNIISNKALRQIRNFS